MPTPKTCRMSSPRFKRAGMQQHALEDVVVTAQMDPPHPTGLVQMRKRPLQPFAALPQQPFAARASNAPTVTIDRVPRLRVLLPATPAAIGLGDVTSHAHRFEIHQLLVAVIALVADDFFEPVALGHDCFNGLGGFDQRLDGSSRGRLRRQPAR